ncbi:MAG: RNA polymerase factor sigma-54 [Proteobacteria bacterium]|nr:RNA polymerase factor sigma-54 [Pseudomonadota bacterium]
MKQSLQLKLGQQLSMTPQLQQAIKLLQLSTLDLQLEIQQALENNPLLEISEDDADQPADASGSDPDAAVEGTEAPVSRDGPLESLEGEASGAQTADEDWNDTLPEELPVDTQWEDALPSASAPPPSTSGTGDFDFEGSNSVAESLQDSLLWQLNLTRLSDVDKAIAVAIIDATDNDGRLTLSLEEIHDYLALDEESGMEVDFDEVVAVLHCLQQFEPSGVCTRDLQECLLVQLQQLPPETPWLEQARQLLKRHISQLGNGDYSQILRRTKLSEEDLAEVLALVQTLDPHPGQAVQRDSTEYIAPDVYVTKKNNRWVLELNPDIAPKLRINSDYANLIKRADSSPDNTFLRENLQEARWFLKSLHSRNETLMKVASKIVERQRGFLEYGEEAMKPLVLHDIADAVEMHESTISRVTTQKYMHTPRGIFELKYFFSSHVATTSGGECSSTAIRALIKKLVAAENPRKPLSDNKITQLLEEQGIKVARRTIAKYRDILFIPPSNERKRLV